MLKVSMHLRRANGCAADELPAERGAVRQGTQRLHARSRHRRNRGRHRRACRAVVPRAAAARLCRLACQMPAHIWPR